jgi:hypothetical protein
MADAKHPAWARHLDSIADELLRLSTACDVRLRDPGVIERILHNDETVCGTKNPIGFRKLHSLVLATFSSLNKAIDRIGPEETKIIIDGIRERVGRLQAAGRGSPPAGTRSDTGE